MSGERESMVVRRHENGALEIVSQGTETQLISRDLLVDVVASLNQNLAEIERLRAVLRYISSPAMSLPGGADAAQHALVADARAVRLALQTCIRMAREALSNGSASATNAGGQP